MYFPTDEEYRYQDYDRRERKILMLKNPPRHCRQMLYPLNYQESPRFMWKV